MTDATPGLRTILDLLEIRGCRTDFQHHALGPARGAWVIFYPTADWDDADASAVPFRSRMIYPDERGEKQAMELLQSLNAGVADPKAMKAAARKILKLQEET